MQTRLLYILIRPAYPVSMLHFSGTPVPGVFIPLLLHVVGDRVSSRDQAPELVHRVKLGSGQYQEQETDNQADQILRHPHSLLRASISDVAGNSYQRKDNRSDFGMRDKAREKKSEYEHDGYCE